MALADVIQSNSVIAGCGGPKAPKSCYIIQHGKLGSILNHSNYTMYIVIFMAIFRPCTRLCSRWPCTMIGRLLHRALKWSLTYCRC